MRYRRLSYRYALIVTTREPPPIGEFTLSERSGVRLAQTCWRPPADIYETATSVIVTIELAGVDEEDPDIVLFEDAVIVEGVRRLYPAESPGVYHTAEIRQGRFRIDVPLPVPIDPDNVEARYERGLLRIALAKKDGR